MASKPFLKSRPRRSAKPVARIRHRNGFFFSLVQTISITGSGGLVLGGTGNLSQSVYGPGAAGHAAPGRSRRIGA